MSLRYDWRVRKTTFALCTWSEAYWQALQKGLHALPLVAHDPATQVTLFERPPPKCLPLRVLRRPPTHVQDLNRWGHVITRVRLRPRPQLRTLPKQRVWHFLRGGRQRKYLPVPNCFDDEFRCE